MFSGSIVAIVTPFKNGLIDEKAYEKLVEFQIANGTKGIVPCGTTGESATLSHTEHNYLVKLTCDIVQKRVPVIAGTGSNSTAEAIALTARAKEVGANAALLISPYYNKPTQEGLYQHFKKIAEEIDFPIVIYNVPSRTAVSINPDTVARLSEIKQIVAIKDATGNLDYTSEVVSKCNITILSGNDSQTFPMMALGAKGVISVAANIIPKDVAEMVDSFLDGDIEKAKKLHFKMFKLFNALFYETNPIPVKAALELMGIIGSEIRLPLTKMSEDNKAKLIKEMEEYGLLVKR
jgi:4-hydroxy-tetrahydrodipicolinate synthase